MSEVQALVHDVFGTVVDWRGAVTADGEALAARKGITGVDWQQFADEWRGLYAPSMNKVRTGELALDQSRCAAPHGARPIARKIRRRRQVSTRPTSNG